jgi:hypothetical protein
MQSSNQDNRPVQTFLSVTGYLFLPLRKPYWNHDSNPLERKQAASMCVDVY